MVLGGSVLKVDLAGVMRTKKETSGFGFQVMLGGSLCVSGRCELKLYFGTIKNIAYDNYSYIIKISHLWLARLDVFYIWCKLLYVAWEVQF